jgi:Rha family phage regulatory protein
MVPFGRSQEPKFPTPDYYVELGTSTDGNPEADSLGIAARFGRRHADVLRAIDQLLEIAPNERRNFAFPSYVAGNNQEQTYAVMNRDGFTLLVMGFNGVEAVKWKVAYIAAFNRMEAALRGRAPVATKAPTVRELAQMVIDAEDRADAEKAARLAAEAHNNRLTHGISALASIAEHYESELTVRRALERSAGTVTPSIAAKILGQPIKKFNKWCIGKYIFYRGKWREPYAHYLSNGMMEMAYFHYKDLETPKHLREYFDAPQPGWTSYSVQPFFTDKGLRHLAMRKDLPDPSSPKLLEQREKIRLGVSDFLDNDEFI